ncbi:MAG: hypothetical protein K8Q91_03475 [Candidatus Vogelbacteria bacterium]|nr:hypothetical protein [Candidatus Vogelbacteria bacterium]
MADDSQIKNIQPSENSSDDFIPLPKQDPVNIDPSGTVTDSPNRSNLTDKLKAARLAMQGPERTIQRERNERERQIDKEKSELGQSLSLITKKKEDMEIGWVVLDNKRVDLKKMLAPLLDEEEKLETAEDELEGRERTTSLPTDRQKIEKERWVIQDKRKELEKQKWGFEDKITKVETLIKESTEKYQTLLDEEEITIKKLDDLESELSLIAEQARLEEEEAMRKAEIAHSEIEKKRREEVAKKEQAELEVKRKEELEKKIAEEKKKKEAEEIKKQEELKKQEQAAKANTAANLELEKAKAAALAQKAIDETKKKVIEMAQLKARGETELQRQQASKINTLGVTPNNSVPAIDIVKEEIKTKLSQINTKTENGDIPVATTEEENLLPKLRTLKSDLAKIKGIGGKN